VKCRGVEDEEVPPLGVVGWEDEVLREEEEEGGATYWEEEEE